MILTTLGRNGFPHSVPMGYFRDGGEVYIGTRPGTQKVRNVQRDPRVALLLESGSTMADLKGLMIQGEATVVDETGELLRVARAAARSRGVAEDELPSEPPKNAVYIRVVPKRIISWDYSAD